MIVRVSLTRINKSLMWGVKNAHTHTKNRFNSVNSPIPIIYISPLQNVIHNEHEISGISILDVFGIFKILFTSG